MSTGTTIQNAYGETLNFYVSTQPNGADPNVIQLQNGQGVNAKPDLTLIQIQSASSSSEVPPNGGWSNATHISNQLADPVTLFVSTNGSTPAQILLPGKTAINYNFGVTSFKVTPA